MTTPPCGGVAMARITNGQLPLAIRRACMYFWLQ